MADLYEILGVDPTASREDIKRAYRKKARELHPDAGGDEDAFKEVTRAYEVLSDPDRRRRYDRFGDEGDRVGADPFGFGAAGFGDLSHVIGAFFGGANPFGGGAAGDPFGTAGTRRRTSRRGRDVAVAIEIDLEEVLSGTRRDVEVEVLRRCQACGAGGSASGSGTVRCQTCGGSGQVQRVVRSAFGNLATSRPCPDCEGTGERMADPCRECRGEGRQVERRTLTVEIPPGIDDGDRLRVGGAGEAGRRGAGSGDLYVQLHVRSHEIFVREGRDLWCEVTVPVVHAALGATLRVPGLDGDEIDVELPAGTQPGEVVVVRRAGLPQRGGGSRGDLKVQVHVEVPRTLSTEERELLERFAEVRGEELPPAGRGLFDRLREAFR